MRPLTRFVVRFALVGSLIAAVSSGDGAQAGMVAHWRLNEGSGDTFLDLAGVNHGFLENDAEISWTIDSPPTQSFAVEFSGSNSYIRTPFAGIGGASPRTIAFWFKTTTADVGGMVGYGVGNANTEKWHMRLNNNAGNGVLGAFRSEFQGGFNVATTVVNDGQWHHVAAVLPVGGSQSTDVVHFIDGQQDARSSTAGIVDINTNITDPNSATVTIGASRQGGGTPTPPDRFFTGSLADVRFYDEVLSAAQIQAIMVEGEITCIPGDVDCNDILDLADYFIIRDNFQGTITGPGQGDLNFDGRVDARDFRIWKDAFDVAPAAVPEPAGAAVAILCAATVGLTRNVRRRS